MEKIKKGYRIEKDSLGEVYVPEKSFIWSANSKSCGKFPN